MLTVSGSTSFPGSLVKERARTRSCLKQGQTRVSPGGSCFLNKFQSLMRWNQLRPELLSSLNWEFLFLYAIASKNNLKQSHESLPLCTKITECWTSNATVFRILPIFFLANQVMVWIRIFSPAMPSTNQICTWCLWDEVCRLFYQLGKTAHRDPEDTLKSNIK